MSVGPMPMMLELSRLAAEQPDAPALGDHRQQLTYGEMVERVMGLASELARHPTPGHTVVFVAQRAEAVIALLASLWAGRGVCPLDPTEPPERLAALVKRARPAVIIDAVGGSADSFSGIPVINGTRRFSGRVEPLPAGGNEPGVILFTSGSTGTPKSVVRSIDDINKCLVDPPLFGTGHSGMCVPLHFAGGLTAALNGPVTNRPLTMIDVREHSIAELTSLVRSLNLQRLMFTPSLARTMARSMLGREKFDTVTDVHLMGEALEWADVPALRAMAAPSATITIPMGASEAVNALFMMTVTPDMPIGVGRVPMGVPTVPSRIHLEPLEGAPQSTQLVAREGVVAGYWDTNDRPDSPFGIDEDGVRFWRSGDIVELTDQGEYFHRGRIDDMMKVGGRLVEPAEVEAAISVIDGVNCSVVLPHELPSGRKVLVAHVEASAECDVAFIRRTLRRTLPSYLVPTHIVRHDALPLNARGKLDRAGIAALPVTLPESDPGFGRIEPLEHAVCGTIAAILELPALGPTDDIWDLGCDSLAAVQIIGALADAYPSNLGPNDLLESRTARDLTQRLQDGETFERSHVVTLNGGGSRPPLYIVAGSGTPALTFQPLAMALTSDQPLVVYEQYGLHQDVTPDPDIASAAERNLVDLRRRSPDGPCDIAGYSWGGMVAHCMAAKLSAEGRNVRLISLDAIRVPRTGPTASRIVRRSKKLAKALVSPKKLRRAVSGRVGRAAIGTTARYDQFFRQAMSTAHSYEPVSLNIPILVVSRPDSPVAADWNVEPNVRHVEVTGNHFTLLQNPFVLDTATAIRDFLS